MRVSTVFFINCLNFSFSSSKILSDFKTGDVLSIETLTGVLGGKETLSPIQMHVSAINGDFGKTV